MTDYANTTLTILEHDCDGDAEAYRDWVAANYPEIDIDYRENTSGVNDGHVVTGWDNLSDDERDALKSLYGPELDETNGILDSRLWEKFCNAQ